ncbi:MAG: XdhC family protein [Desulfovibrio sp.]|nr:XdhC family protein [Desulfovibrio sp.]
MARKHTGAAAHDQPRPGGGSPGGGSPERLADAPWEETLEARAAELLQAGEAVVLVTVVARTGSAPRDAGTRALQTRRGFEGTVGGGALEARAMEAARQRLADGGFSLSSFDLSGTSPENDMICGGGMQVLCETLRPEQAGLFALAAETLRQGARGVWVAELRGVSSSAVTVRRRLYVESLFQEDGLPVPEGVTVGLEPALPLLEERKNRPGLLAFENDTLLYVEPLDAPPVLLLCGGGHVSLEVARLAHASGFVVDVADDREDFANAERFPMARRCLVLPGFDNLVERCGIGRRHYVAIVTRGHSFDREALAQALTSHAQYIGMIGSRGKREQVYAALRATGVPDAELAAVCCPIGLSIGAQTPQQIAVAVVAELLAARAGTLTRLRFDN